MRCSRGVIRVALLLAVAAGMGASGCQSQSPEPSTQTRVEDVFAGLERKEIALDLEGTDQDASLARNIYFIFDGSGSMSDAPDAGCGGDRSFATKLEGAKWAVREFLQKVPDGMNLGLYVFDNRARSERVALGDVEREAFLRAVDGIRAGGKTPLAEAMRFGTDRLIEQYRKQLGYGEYRLVVVTDGLAENIPEAARYAAEYGMPVYAIGLCVQEDHPLRQVAVSYRAADNFSDLAKGLEETLAELPSFDATEFPRQGE